MYVVKSTYAAKKFGEVAQRAQQDTVRVESNGRESVYIISASKYRELLGKHRTVHVAGSIPSDVLTMIRDSKPVKEAAAFNHEVD